MLSRDRLRTTPEIRAVFAGGTAVGGSLLVVHARPRDCAGPSRVAVVAGRKVGGAVQRNRAKRRIRGALAHTQVPDGFDVVVTAKNAILPAPFARVCSELDRTVGRATRAGGAR